MKVRAAWAVVIITILALIGWVFAAGGPLYALAVFGTLAAIALLAWAIITILDSRP